MGSKQGIVGVNTGGGLVEVPGANKAIAFELLSFAAFYNTNLGVYL